VLLLPKALSLTRLLVGISFPWLPDGARWGAALFAIMSDLADGAVSRRLHSTSMLGRLLDPLADKVFVLAVVLTLLWEGALGLGQVLLVGLRDIAVCLGAAWWLAHGEWEHLKTLKPRLSGKITTAAQLLFILVLLVHFRHAEPWFFVTVGLSAFAALDYSLQFFRGSSI
jgi:phosphatidylglycerophosphate synthase